MNSSNSNTSSAAMIWTGRILTALTSAFMIMGGVMDLAKPANVVENTIKMGYSESVMAPLGIVLLIITALYLIPRTAVLGAILLTGYLGGAVDCHVRAGQTAEMFFPIIFAILVWGGIFLREPKLRALIPCRQ